MTSALERGEWSASRPGRTLPPGKTRYSLYRRLGGPQGQYRRAENFDPAGIRSPDRPAPSQSLYRRSYPAHLCGRNFVYWWRPSSDSAACSDTLQLFSRMQRYDHLWFIQTCLDTHRVLKPHDHFMLTLRRLMSYIYGAPILDVSRSHTTTQHSR